LAVPPYFKPTYPLAVKYGGYGSVIGHELSHAFDATGVYEPPIFGQPWLKNSTFNEFEKRKNCLIDLFDKYCFKNLNACVSGANSIPDNIADINGIKAAYLAYKWVARTVGGDIPMPQLAGYTTDQIFFVSATRQYCSKNDPTLDLLQEAHAPERTRIEMMLRHMPQATDAFHCPENPVREDCTLWGDFSNRIGKESKKSDKPKVEEETEKMDEEEFKK